MAIESLQADVGDPFADALLIHALRLLVEGLPLLVTNPGEPSVRLKLMVAALLCGQGSDYVGGGLAQALAHAAGPRSRAANGLVEGILLRHTVRHTAAAGVGNLSAVADVLTTAGIPEGGENVLAALERLLDSVDVPRRLRAIGLPVEAIPDVVEHVLNDWTLTRIPAQVGAPELTELLNSAW